MTYTLSDLLQAVYAELGQLQVSTATGGSASTVVDSQQAGLHSDEDWKRGALFVVAADDEAPQGEFGRISQFTASSGTFTLEEDLSAAVAAGDSYGVASGYFPLATMIELVNGGLRGLGDIALVDSSSLETAAGTTEYAAAVSWKRRRPLMIDVQGRVGASGDKGWQRVYDWDFVPASPGSAGQIVFAQELPAGRALRIWYVGSHPRLNAYDDPLSATIAPELAVAAGVERALRWGNSRLSGGDPYLLQRWNDAKVELERARLRFPVWAPRRVGRLMTLREEKAAGG